MNVSSLLKELNSWNDFQTKLLSLNKKEKGDAFELLTKLYFKINPVFSFYDEVWMLSEVPQKTLEYLKIPSHDLGIDLIAKNGNEYHAIQCKFHTDIDSSVSFKEVATFISLLEGNKNFTQGYICSSANVTSRNLEKIETKPITTILADTWQNLDKDFFYKARLFLNKEKYAPIAYNPKEHQIKALKQAVKHFVKEDNSRGKLIFPCGSGKSLTGYWITQELKSKSTIIAVPSLSLVKQTLDVYLREIVAKGKKVKWLCICSDEGIGSEEDIVFKTENLGVPCQTDPVYIKKWLLENKDENIVIFTTYQSGRIIAEVSKDLKFKFDVGIFDEAHKTVGSDKKLFSHLLFEENISIDKRIFMTATERFYAGSKDDIISMDDEDVYGDTFAQMSFKEAIEMELLTDYKVITIEVTQSEIADFIKDNDLVQLNDKWKKETEARSLASMLALRKAMKLYPIKNAVSFHSSIDKAVRNKELQSYITDTYNYNPIDTFTVSGKMPTTKRNIIVKEFADSPKALITNARCLTEGVDVPNIDCIVFADPRKSKVDIVQALGRALRKKEGKDWGYVILPVVYDDITQEIDNENFNEILAIVRGLASNDDRIVEYFKDKKEGASSTKKENAEQFHFEVFSDYVDANQLSEQLQIKLWDKLSQFNWLPFEEAREQVRALGLRSSMEWRAFDKAKGIPSNIPKRPDNAYKNSGWISFGDWLGTGRRIRGYRSLEDAKKLALSLKLSSRSHWIVSYEKGLIPNDIPKNPDLSYKNKGWLNWGDFLGSGKIASHLIVYRNFKEAKKYVKNLGLNNGEEWKKFCASGDLPLDIPRTPSQTYKNKGWNGLPDWLGAISGTGTKYKDRTLYSYEEAKKYVHGLKLKNWKDWMLFTKFGQLPIDIPKDPSLAYKNKGWINWGEWLGNGKVATKEFEFLPYKEARQFVHELGLKSTNEWRKYCLKRPKNLPSNPEKVYKDKGWINFGDFIGTNNFRNKDRIYLSFEQSLLYSRSLNLMNEKEWRNWKKHNAIPENIPAKPEVYYKESGWCGYSFWLTNKFKISNSKKNFLEFEKAKIFVRELGLMTGTQWREYCKSSIKPIYIPSNPDKVYRTSGWKSMSDWLGVDIIANSNKMFLDFDTAREIIHKLNLINQKQWNEYCNSGQKPNSIPTNPHLTYKNLGWLGLGDWLGNGAIANSKMEFVAFDTARNHARNLKLNSVKEWNLYSKSGKRPSNIPSNPQNPYKNKGWKGWADFLGKEK
jgi:superfamily II DNA or RNA helicase